MAGRVYQINFRRIKGEMPGGIPGVLQVAANNPAHAASLIRKHLNELLEQPEVVTDISDQMADDLCRDELMEMDMDLGTFSLVDWAESERLATAAATA